MKKVFVVGGVSYDQIIYLHELPEKKAGSIFSSGSQKSVGSTGAGKSLNFEKLGFETTFHAFVGNDEEGMKIKEYFNGRNIKFLIDEDKESTLRFTNLIDREGNRISIFTAYNTFEPEFDINHLEKYVEECDYLVLNIMNYCRHLIPLAKKYKKEIWCDLHDYDGTNEYHNDFIEAADYLFLSSDKMVDYRSFMEKMIKAGKKFVVCTHGKNGSTALDSRGNWIEEGIIEEYKKVDINGAGDSFFAGVLYGYSKGASLEECLRLGTINGGLCITSKELFYEGLSAEFLEKEYRKHYKKLD